MKLGRQNPRTASYSASTPAPLPTPVLSNLSDLSTSPPNADSIRSGDRDESLGEGVVPDVVYHGIPLKTERYRPYTVADKQEADRIAREAVQAVLDRQADTARYDMAEGNRIVLTLDEDTIRAYRTDWEQYNSTLPPNTRINFSTYLQSRLKSCIGHTSARPIHIRDHIRQQIETLFGDTIMSDEDLANQIDRRIRPIVESPEGELRLDPFDPLLVERIVSWDPDRTPAQAVSVFVTEAAMGRAGFI